MMASLCALWQTGVLIMFLTVAETNGGAEYTRLTPSQRITIRQVKGGIYVCGGRHCAFFRASWFKSRYPSLFHHPNRGNVKRIGNNDGDRCCPTIRSMRWLEEEEDIHGVEYTIIHIENPPTYQHVQIGYCGEACTYPS